MSTWRLLAYETFPELETALGPLESTVDLYSELSTLLRDSLESENAEMVQRIINFAVWGAAQSKNEQFIHGTMHLFEGVIESGRLRSALWRRMSVDQFAKLNAFFVNGMSLNENTPTREEMKQEFVLSRKAARHSGLTNHSSRRLRRGLT